MTLEEIGRLAKVSKSTVSRVINDQDGVSPDARRRVEEVIAQTGFRPNMAARSLASSRTGVIGLVIPSHIHTLFTDPYFSVLIQGISRASNQAGTTLSLFLFETEEEEADIYPRVVASGFVDGVVLTATRMGDPLVERLQQSGIPWVSIGRPDDESAVSFVDADNYGGGRTVASHLCNLGYRRIGIVGAPASSKSGAARLNGFEEGMASCGVDLDPSLITLGDYTEVGGYEGMQRLLPLRPEAVFVASDTMSVGALRAIRESGLDVPGDIALASFDGFDHSAQTDPPLTTVRQFVGEAGSRAMHLLLDLIDGERPRPSREIIPTELIVRESCGASRIQLTDRDDRS